MTDERAQHLRKNSTGPERKLWAALGKLRQQKFHFRRQVRFGTYIADFASHRERLVIEVDGAQHYDDKRKRWVKVSTVTYPINGGRDGGYRGYTIKRNPAAGEWRVDFATSEGHLLGRERFNVEQTPPVNPVSQNLD